jgi:hypothetical protein
MLLGESEGLPLVKQNPLFKIYKKQDIFPNGTTKT